MLSSLSEWLAQRKSVNNENLQITASDSLALKIKDYLRMEQDSLMDPKHPVTLQDVARTFFPQTHKSVKQNPKRNNVLQ